MERVSKINYYLDIAETVSERATCLRRRFGAIIVKNDVIISTGYNGAPRGRVNCSDRGAYELNMLSCVLANKYKGTRTVARVRDHS